MTLNDMKCEASEQEKRKRASKPNKHTYICAHTHSIQFDLFVRLYRHETQINFVSEKKEATEKDIWLHSKFDAFRPYGKRFGGKNLVVPSLIRKLNAFDTKLQSNESHIETYISPHTYLSQIEYFPAE